MKSVRKLIAGILTVAMVLTLIPGVAGIKETQAAETTVITAPGNNSLVAAGYIRIAWKETGGSVKKYEVYIDGIKVGETTGTEYEYYTTKVKKFSLYINTRYTDGSSSKSKESVFFVTKKGLAVNDTMGRNLSPLEMNMGWYYTWGRTAFSYTTYKNAEFVPMQWGAGNEAANINTAVQQGYRYFLGYNEPDMGGDVGGSNMTVQTALNNWPQLSGKNIHLGSPAPALCPAWSNGSWFRSFMDGVDQNTFEFIPLHCYYGTYGGADAANTFLREVVDGTWNMYHKKIWVTEFAISGWGYSNEYGRTKVKEFMETVIQGLNERDYVERYSWFSFNTTDEANGASALWTNSTGVLTELGEIYVNEGNPEGYDYNNLPQPEYKTTIKNKNGILAGSTTINNVSCEDYAAKSGVSATASSTEGNNKADLVLDDNIKSRWESKQGKDPQYIILDLGEVRKIKQVNIVWEGASAATYTIDISTDGTKYETVATVISDQGERWDIVEFAQMKSARYIRIYGTSRTTQYGYSIWDMAVYGTENQIVDQTTTKKQTTKKQNSTTKKQEVTTQRVVTTTSKEVTTLQELTTSLEEKEVSSTTTGTTKASVNKKKTEVKKPKRVVIKKATKKKNSKKAKIVLKKLKNVKGYQIRYCDNKKFQGYEQKTIKKKSVKITLKGLMKRTTYYVKVRAYNKVNGTKKYGKWSKKIKIQMRRKK
ncbi:MAG: discoidin domain-containing protein [Eubacterium sp.]|nr:discoidin domain-containing protein [Eubacterium sp.]